MGSDGTGYKNSSLFLAPFGVNISESVDWREKDYVTPIKNQVTF